MKHNTNDLIVDACHDFRYIHVPFLFHILSFRVQTINNYYAVL